MVNLKPDTCVAALIGDVVGSRESEDRADLHHRLDKLIGRANDELQPLVPLRITVGDEYQGCFATVGEALHAAMWLRLDLMPESRPSSRGGMGAGGGARGGTSRRGRAGLVGGPRGDRVGEGGGRALVAEAPPHGLPAAPGVQGPDPESVNAALVCRDQLVGSLSQRSLRLLQGSFAGRTQAILAEEEGVSASAVSQRFRNDGLAAILAAEELLRRVT